MHRDLASVLGDDQVQEQARDTALDRQLFASVGSLGPLTGDLNDDARAAFDERVIVSRVTQHLHVRVVVQVVGSLQLLIGADDAAADSARGGKQCGGDIQRDAIVLFGRAGQRVHLTEDVLVLDARSGLQRRVVVYRDRP
jgi:hypothetical protein